MVKRILSFMLLILFALSACGNDNNHYDAIGSIIQFGEYDWRVLDVDGNYALVITENVISYRPYHPARADIMAWEMSGIRGYLNNIFYNTFSEQDRARIRETYVIDNHNRFWGRAGDNTYDKIFLLSIEEVVRYFSDSGQLQYRPSRIYDHYNSARIAKNANGTASVWWLRSTGSFGAYTTVVNSDGIIDLIGRYVRLGIGGGVRPALWLNLEY